MKNNYLYTSESVSSGHPDKIADQIADTILDEILKQDPVARVACEVTVSTGLVLIVGEISTSAVIDIQSIVRSKIKEIGYRDQLFGFDGDTCSVLVSLDKQSPDIAQGVDALEDDDIVETGAGDQGMMFGFATNECKNYMPLGSVLTNYLMKQIAEVRNNNILDYLGPDAKTQVTIEYSGDDKPKRIETIVLSTQHKEGVSINRLKKDIIEKVIKPVVPNKLLDKDTKILINPTGKFILGGPQADSGLTGRKIIVDSYGGYALSGGGAFSGKDPTKVDRSGAYMARYIAKNLVAAGVAPKIEIQIAYAIGTVYPVSINVNTFNKSKYSDQKIIKIINKVFDLRPGAIIQYLDLQKPIYSPLAVYGHFGREELNVSWEKLDKVIEIQSLL